MRGKLTNIFKATPENIWNYKQNHPLYNKNRSEKDRENISKGMKGIPKTKEHKQKLSKVNIGKKDSLETKQKKSKAHKGKKQKILKCPYCGKEGGTTMHRWHFENCKFKKDINNE
jgi:hypothetical protein